MNGNTIQSTLICLLIIFVMQGILLSQEEEPEQDASEVQLETVISTIKQNTSDLSSISGQLKMQVTSKEEQKKNYLLRQLKNVRMAGEFSYNRETFFSLDAYKTNSGGYPGYLRVQHVIDRNHSSFRIKLLTENDHPLAFGFKTPLSRTSPDSDAITTLVRNVFRGPMMGWGLLEFYLFPEGLKEHGEQWTISEEKKDGVTHFALKRSIGENQEKFPWKPKETVFVNKSSGQIKKVTYEFSDDRAGHVLLGQRVIVKPDETKAVAGVDVPTRFTVDGSKGTVSVKLSNLKTNQENEKIRKPEWPADPVLPVIGEESMEDIKKTVEDGEPAAVDHVRYAFALVSNQLFGREKNEGGKNTQDILQKQIRKAQEKQTDSILGNEMLGMIYFISQSPQKAGSLVKKLKKRGIEVPFLQLVVGLMHYENEKYEEARKLLSPLSHRKAYKGWSREILFKLNLVTENDPEKMASRIQEEIGTGELAENWERLGTIEPSPKTRGSTSGILSRRGEKFLSVLEEKASSDMMNVLLARAYANKGNVEKAVSMYKNLPLEGKLKKEAASFVDQVDEEKVWSLVSHVLEEIQNPNVLLKYASKQYKEENDKEAVDALKQMASILEKQLEDDEYVRHHRHARLDRNLLRNEGTETIKKTNEAGHKDLSRKLLILMVRKRPYIIYRDNVRSVIRDSFGSSPEELYPLVRHIKKPRYVGKLINPSNAVSVVQKRREEDRMDRTDYEFVARLAGAKRVIENLNPQELIPILKKGVEDHPDVFQLQERYADVLFLGDNRKEARKQYEHLLKEKIKRRKNSDNGLSESRSTSRGYSFRHAEEWKYEPEDPLESSFSPSDNEALKYARTLRKLGKQKEGRKLLREYRELFGQRAPNDMATAFQFVGDDETAFKILRDRLRNHLDDRSRYQLYHISKPLLDFLVLNERYNQAFLVARTVMKKFGNPDRDIHNRLQNRLQTIQDHIKEQVSLTDIVNNYLSNQDTDSLSDEKQNEIRNLVKQLGNRSYKKRKKAMNKLTEYGEKAVPVLKEFRDSSNAEVKKRVNDLIRKNAMENLRRELFPEENTE